MKLTEQQVKFFKDLHGTEIGKLLVEYVDSLGSYICDSRNWEALGIKDKEVAVSADRVMKQFISDKIRLQNKPRQVSPNPME